MNEESKTSLLTWLKRLTILLFVITLYFFCRYIGIIGTLLRVLGALAPLYIAVFVSWLLTPMARFFNQKLKIKWFLSCALSIMIFLIIVCLIIFSIMPQIVFQIRDFISNLTSIITNLFTQLESAGLFDPNSNFIQEVDIYLAQYNLSISSIFQQSINFLNNQKGIISSSLNTVVDIIKVATNVITQFAFGIILTFYLMPNLEKYYKLVIKQGEKFFHRDITDDIKDISTTLRAYLKGMGLDTLILFLMLTVLTTIFFGSKISILSIMVFCLIAALFNIIPYIGNIIGAIPLALVVFQSYSFKGLILIILIIILVQFIEANVVSPRIMSNSINLNPVTIMTGLLIFSSIFGFVGMFFAVPMMSIMKIFLVKFNIIGEEYI